MTRMQMTRQHECKMGSTFSFKLYETKTNYVLPLQNCAYRSKNRCIFEELLSQRRANDEYKIMYLRDV